MLKCGACEKAVGRSMFTPKVELLSSKGVELVVTSCVHCHAVFSAVPVVERAILSRLAELGKKVDSLEYELSRLVRR